MGTENPTTKTIGMLKGCSFYIPAYQRGYRWTDQEVGDLLTDIYEFDIGSQSDSKMYCLQPLIVKKRDRKGNSFEVVDGQQRLTTLFIFLKIAERKTEEKLYNIEFETREQSGGFLSGLSDNTIPVRKDNIDYYHITKAHTKITAWLEERAKGDTVPLFTVLTTLFNKITNNVFFIWYELPESVKAVEIFTRVNMGKIRLSNAELIKALIFNKDNFSETSERQQQELSLAWNRIERDLQNDSLWYFLVEEDQREYETRIDLLFDLLAEKYNNELPENVKIKVPKSAKNENRTFLIFYMAYKNAENKNKFVIDLWKKVEKNYEQFLEWYSDLNTYHIIGFLINAGTSLERVFELSYEKKKSEINSAIVEETKKHIKLNSRDGLEALMYNDKKKDLRNFFLLVNIATLVCKNEKQYRFPFHLYKKDKWDIEHIHAIADTSDKIEESDGTDNSIEQDDSIGNLTLLSAEINRSYKDASFPEKRKEIILRDKKGMFIPICTKNVFMKQYSEKVDNMNKWEEADKIDYVQAMWEVLDNFWKGECVK